MAKGTGVGASALVLGPQWFPTIAGEQDVGGPTGTLGGTGYLGDITNIIGP